MYFTHSAEAYSHSSELNNYAHSSMYVIRVNLPSCWRKMEAIDSIENEDIWKRNFEVVQSMEIGRFFA